MFWNANFDQPAACSGGENARAGIVKKVGSLQQEDARTSGAADDVGDTGPLDAGARWLRAILQPRDNARDAVAVLRFIGHAMHLAERESEARQARVQPFTRCAVDDSQ